MRPDPGEQDQHGRAQRGERCGGHRNAPVDAAERVHQVRRGRAQRERADQDAHQQPHVAPGPRRGELHADRVDAGQRDAGDEAQQRRVPGRRVDEQQPGVGDRPGDRRERDQPPRIAAVGEPQGGAREAARDEPGLHAAGERRLHEAGEADLRDQRGHDRRRGEPQCHGADLRSRDERDRDRAWIGTRSCRRSLRQSAGRAPVASTSAAASRPAGPGTCRRGPCTRSRTPRRTRRRSPARRPRSRRSWPAAASCSRTRA